MPVSRSSSSSDRTAALRYSRSMTRTIAPMRAASAASADDERLLRRDRLGRRDRGVDDQELTLGPVGARGGQLGDLVGELVGEQGRHHGIGVLDADRQEPRRVVGGDAASRGEIGRRQLGAGLLDRPSQERRRRDELGVGLDEVARRGQRLAVRVVRADQQLGLGLVCRVGSATPRHSRRRRRPTSPRAASTTTASRPQDSRSVPRDPLGNTPARTGLIRAKDTGSPHVLDQKAYDPVPRGTGRGPDRRRATLSDARIGSSCPGSGRR